MIEFRNVSQSYKDHKVLTDINMTIQSGEFVVLIGSSGCGKTTLLKTINKLTSLAGGDLLIDGVSIRDIPDIALRRRIGYVIQDGGLFPHLTVEENISLLLETVGMPSDKIPARVDEVLEMEPNVSENVYAALYAPTGGIVCPFNMTIAFAENACVNGVEFRFDTEVLNISRISSSDSAHLILFSPNLSISICITF